MREPIREYVRSELLLSSQYMGYWPLSRCVIPRRRKDRRVSLSSFSAMVLFIVIKTNPITNFREMFTPGELLRLFGNNFVTCSFQALGQVIDRHPRIDSHLLKTIRKSLEVLNEFWVFGHGTVVTAESVQIIFFPSNRVRVSPWSKDDYTYRLFQWNRLALCD